MAPTDKQKAKRTKKGIWSRMWSRGKKGNSDSPELSLLDKDYNVEDAKSDSSGDPQLPVIGIDFGTSYSSVALITDEGIDVIPVDGDVMIPSVVCFPEPGQVIVGQNAKERLAGSAQWTVTSPKRLLGRLYKDQSAQRLFNGLAFRTFAGSDRYIRFEAHESIYSAQDICAEIIKLLKKAASEYVGREIKTALLTAPVGFGSLQRSALEQSARQAGLAVTSILSEPTAALLAQGLPSSWTGKVAIYDFGGGTFDFCVLDVSSASYTVVCSGGDPWLGGDDFDLSIAEQLADAFERETSVDLRSRQVEWQKLLLAAERAKRKLSTESGAEVRVDDLIITRDGAKGLASRVSAPAFEQLTAPLVHRSITVVERVLHQANIHPDDVDIVLMTGGTSLLPAVKQAVTEFFGKEPVLSEPHLAVVKGAAVQAGALSGVRIARAALRGRRVEEVVGRTIGAGVDSGPIETIFERSTPIPATKTHRFFTIANGQTQMVIRLYEQNTSRVDQSKPLGKVFLKGLHGLSAGQEFVEVTFTLDQNGVLAVNANVAGRPYRQEIRTRKSERLDLKGGPNQKEVAGEIGKK